MSASFQEIIESLEQSDLVCLVGDILNILSLEQKRFIMDKVEAHEPLVLDSSIAAVGSVCVAVSQFQDMLDTINDKIMDDYDEEPLTIENVKARPDLMEYIVQEAVKDGGAIHDPDEFWNNDGWCDLVDHLR